MGGISDRHQEIKRRRKRRVKFAKWKKKLETATPSIKQEIAAKLRNLTPGADVKIEEWGLHDADR